ncbi:MAG: phosphatase PAP2 family protein [Ignavibacteria bacterium]
MGFFQKIDEALFYFVNVSLANPVTDRLMPFITERNNWFIFYVLIWLYLMFKGGRRGKITAILIVPLILLSDQFSNNIIKTFFQRIRPCHILPDINLLIGCSDAYSFPSIHAVNNFAAATLFSYFYPRMKYFLYAGAFIISVSRIFVGVHYPFDVIGGAVIGILFGFLMIYLWKLINNRFKLLNDNSPSLN